MNELVNRCLNLTRSERAYIIKVLSDSLAEIPDDGKWRFDQMVSVVNDILNDNILRKTKDHKAVVGRWMVAYQMKKEGYTVSGIGRHMRRSHSTIIHMIRMMEDVFGYPQFFKLENVYWEQFRRKDNELHKGTAQDS